MTNKLLIKKLKGQVKSLREMKGRYYWSWFDKTKVYILGLSLDKKDDPLISNVIDRLERFIIKMPRYESSDTDEIILRKNQEISGYVKRIINILETFIEVLQIKGKFLLAEEGKEIEEGIRKELEKEMKKEFEKKVKEMEKKMKKENKETNKK